MGNKEKKKKMSKKSASVSESNKKEIEKICCFCRRSEDNELKYGKFYEHSGIITHYFCLLFSSNMEQNGKDNEGILGFLIDDIYKELRRGKRLHCTYCKKTGATVGCTVARCPKKFHLPCGIHNGSLHQFFGQFRSYCINHRPYQKIEERLKMAVNSSEKIQCYICYDDLDTSDKLGTLWAPCCKKRAWFHRICVQQLALSAGYFFKCPLCNSKKEFHKTMQHFGIYIPEQDASWELVPNAYEELLYRHNRCDAQSCMCPKGRTYSNTNSKWDLILCRLCGSQGIHIQCGQLKWANAAWECEDCTKIIHSKTSVVKIGRINNINRNLNMKAETDTEEPSNNFKDSSDEDSSSDSEISVGGVSPKREEPEDQPVIRLKPGPRSFKLLQTQMAKRASLESSTSNNCNSSGNSNSSIDLSKPGSSKSEDVNEEVDIKSGGMFENKPDKKELLITEIDSDSVEEIEIEDQKKTTTKLDELNKLSLEELEDIYLKQCGKTNSKKMEEKLHSPSKCTIDKPVEVDSGQEITIDVVSEDQKKTTTKLDKLNELSVKELEVLYLKLLGETNSKKMNEKLHSPSKCTIDKPVEVDSGQKITIDVESEDQEKTTTKMDELNKLSVEELEVLYLKLLGETNSKKMNEKLHSPSKCTIDKPLEVDSGHEITIDIVSEDQKKTTTKMDELNKLSVEELEVLYLKLSGETNSKKMEEKLHSPSKCTIDKPVEVDSGQEITIDVVSEDQEKTTTKMEKLNKLSVKELEDIYLKLYGETNSKKMEEKLHSPSKCTIDKPVEVDSGQEITIDIFSEDDNDDDDTIEILSESETADKNNFLKTSKILKTSELFENFSRKKKSSSLIMNPPSRLSISSLFEDVVEDSSAIVQSENVDNVPKITNVASIPVEVHENLQQILRMKRTSAEFEEDDDLYMFLKRRRTDDESSENLIKDIVEMKSNSDAHQDLQVIKASDDKATATVSKSEILHDDQRSKVTLLQQSMEATRLPLEMGSSQMNGSQQQINKFLHSLNNESSSGNANSHKDTFYMMKTFETFNSNNESEDCDGDAGKCPAIDPGPGPSTDSISGRQSNNAAAERDMQWSNICHISNSSSSSGSSVYSDSSTTFNAKDARRYHFGLKSSTAYLKDLKFCLQGENQLKITMKHGIKLNVPLDQSYQRNQRSKLHNSETSISNWENEDDQMSFVKQLNLKLTDDTKENLDPDSSANTDNASIQSESRTPLSPQNFERSVSPSKQPQVISRLDNDSTSSTANREKLNCRVSIDLNKIQSLINIRSNLFQLPDSVNNDEKMETSEDEPLVENSQIEKAH